MKTKILIVMAAFLIGCRENTAKVANTTQEDRSNMPPGYVIECSVDGKYYTPLANNGTAKMAHNWLFTNKSDAVKRAWDHYDSVKRIGPASVQEDYYGIMWKKCE